PEEDFRSFRLEQDFAAREVRPGGFVSRFAIHDVFERVAISEQVEHVPLAVRILVLHFRIAVAGHVELSVGQRALVAAVEAGPGSGYAVAGGGCGSADKDDIAGAALDHLELDRSGPNLVQAGYVEENAAVTGEAGTRRMRGFAPLELGAEMVVGIFFLGDDVAVFRAGDVEHAVMDLEDLLRILVFALLFQKGVEAL